MLISDVRLEDPDPNKTYILDEPGWEVNLNMFNQENVPVAAGPQGGAGGESVSASYASAQPGGQYAGTARPSASLTASPSPVDSARD